ncbi:YdcH family protein [Limimaricola pyoseonensis]|uniref:DUF465 domain-containing protein n=1 Tax=Limimaricola pyoseonensis TaxID=521013 RepID=A0A1G7JIB3_9RHOB|nr:YdcH family protein [Limimaricola pyoseonensis]SDF24605.1 hypothetical protein SAMN04488567_3734 [Limimaricola pyoseonensis]
MGLANRTGRPGARISALNMRISALRARHAALDARIGELRGQASVNPMRLSNLKSRKSRLRDEIRAWEDMVRVLAGGARPAA